MSMSIKEEYEEEEKLYAEVLAKEDWRDLKEAAELFLIHAYSHLLQSPADGYEVLGDTNYVIKYSQFNLNLAVGLELLLKSILLKKGLKINYEKKGVPNPKRTISFGTIVESCLKNILIGLSEETFDEIKMTLKLINCKRDNVAHCSKRSREHYANEYRFSYVTLYIYEESFYGENPELTKVLLNSISKSQNTDT